MTTYLAPSTPAPNRSKRAEGVRSRTGIRTVGRWTNRLLASVAVVQFYSAGLAVFGAAGFELHAAGGWLAQLLSVLTIVLLFAARVPFRVSGLAILLLFLAILQPVLAFAVRATLPALSALHPVNGIAILTICLLLDRRLRDEA